MPQHNIPEQLVEIYYDEEWWHLSKMPEKIAWEYHNHLFRQGNIQVVAELGVVLGYYEVWFIDKKQLGRILLGEKFPADTENITDGNIAFLANAYIDKSFRNGRVFKLLYRRFMEQTKHCTMISGEEQNHNCRFKVFRRK